jgi:hypothetical protein
MRPVKNLPASVKARLLALSDKRGERFNLLVTRFGIERLLYRLSVSAHASRFLLKGAMLFAVWDGKTPRPTTDIDLLGFGSTQKDELVRIFRDVAQTPVPADGLVFDPKSIRAEEIREDNAYGGIRIRLMGWLGKAEVPIQIDVGAGDAVTPSPTSAVFPALLDFPAPHIRAYPIYTVVAEKVEAAAKLGVANTRMKDFFDLWFLSRRFEFDGPTLRQAIEATFVCRRTPLPGFPAPFTDTLANDPAKQNQWSAFLQRNGLTAVPANFPEIVTLVRGFVGPVFLSVRPPAQWRPSLGWQSSR